MHHGKIGMKPETTKIEELLNFLSSLHGSNLTKLRDMAEIFANYIKSLNDFVMLDAPQSYDHIGSAILDWVLQVGHDWEKQVKTAVNKINDFPEARTLSGFINLLNTRYIGDIINFKKDSIKNDLLQAARFLAERGIDSFVELRNWTSSWDNRNELKTFTRHPDGAIFRVGDKTADYLRVIAGHWDAVAVDSNINTLLRHAGISSKLSYDEKRTIVQLAALYLDQRPIDLDISIYQDSVTHSLRYENKRNRNTTIKKNFLDNNLRKTERPQMIYDLARMPKKGDIFKGEVNDLCQYDTAGWRRRDITFYKREILTQKIYGYPKQGDHIELIDTSGGEYRCKFSKPEDENKVCLGTPGELKRWYQKKGFTDEIMTIEKSGCRDKIYFEYSGEGLKYFLFTEEEHTSRKIKI